MGLSMESGQGWPPPVIARKLTTAILGSGLKVLGFGLGVYGLRFRA